ncbi:hypothetical protein LEM8419_00438 [Neolewinella maritima]|uniref:Uncharacterized protein n=1 Tax=Neolewinella maritima TaxID=1383882 RepID=A0ABN8EZ62_9BACT|nr:hypothetical protein [Neolewinella maritima]CAH0999141.1 hypothetical protein LEM8419_00438 [Neolewinella maritima]
MQAPPEPSPPTPTEPGGTEKTVPGNALTEKAAETYQWWNNLATLHPEDPFLVGVGKIGIRVLGILILLALSPLIIAGVVIAFITVL